MFKQQTRQDEFNFVSVPAYHALRESAEKSDSKYVNAVELFELKSLLVKTGVPFSLPLATIAFAALAN